MRIAVGVDGNTIAGHFGHSGDFQVFTVELKHNAETGVLAPGEPCC